MLRGEIWTYRPVLERPGQSTLRIILSADGFNRDDSRVQVMGAHILDRDPGGLLSVRIEPHGWAVLPTVEAVMRRRLVERVGVVSPPPTSSPPSWRRSAPCSTSNLGPPDCCDAGHLKLVGG